MTDDLAASERRTALRRQLSIPVWIEKLPPQVNHPSLVRAQTRDISYRGAFLLAPAIFPVGQRLHLEMGVATDESQNLGLQIKCEAVVVRLQPALPPEVPSGMAVRIEKFDTPRPVQFPEI
jgi:hypothetical protein